MGGTPASGCPSGGGRHPCQWLPLRRWEAPLPVAAPAPRRTSDVVLPEVVACSRGGHRGSSKAEAVILRRRVPCMQSTRPPLALAGVDDAARTKQRSRGGGREEVRQTVSTSSLGPSPPPLPHPGRPVSAWTWPMKACTHAQTSPGARPSSSSRSRTNWSVLDPAG